MGSVGKANRAGGGSEGRNAGRGLYTRMRGEGRGGGTGEEPTKTISRKRTRGHLRRQKKESPLELESTGLVNRPEEFVWEEVGQEADGIRTEAIGTGPSV